MRGSINIIAASGGSSRASGATGGDFGETASILPIPIPLGSASVTVAGGASPTNAVITLTNPVPGVGTSATFFDDEFTTAPWLTHRTWQTGDKWSFGQNVAPNTDGLFEDSGSWWANPVATPAATTVYPAPANGQLSLGLMPTPTGTQMPQGGAIAQSTIGTLINNQLGGGLRLYGYHEFRVRMPNTPGFLFHWNLDDWPTAGTWSVEVDFDLWIDASGGKHVMFSLPAGLPANPNLTVIYQTTSLDITVSHVYGINWQSDHIQAFIDGAMVGQILNPGGDFQVQPAFSYLLTTTAAYQGFDGSPTAASLPTFAQIDYYRAYANPPTTSGSVLVHGYNPGGTGNSISDSVGQNWIIHPDARIGSPPFLTAITNNTKPMAVGATITVGFSNPSTNTQGTAAAWYVPYVNGSSFGSLANVGASGATPSALSITASASGGSTATVLITLPSSGPALDTGVVQVQYRIAGTTAWTAAPSPPTYITPSSGSIQDGFGNTWTLASNGNPVIGTVTDTVSHATELFLIGTTFWQFDGSSWYNFTPSGTISVATQIENQWTGPVATSPLLSPGLVVQLLSGNGTYDISAYVSNSAGAGALSNIPQVTIGSTSTGPGPAASSAFLTADYTSIYHYPTAGSATQNPNAGQMVVQPGLYGVVDGAGGNDGSLIGSFNDTTNSNPFALFTSPTYQSRMATVSPGIWTFVSNPLSCVNLSNNTVATNGYTNLIANFYKVDPLGISSIIIGLDWTQLGVGTAQYGQLMHALAVYFQNQIMPNGKRLPVVGFCGANENFGGADPSTYYNVMVANVKNVTLPGGGTYKVLAAVADWWNDVPGGMNGFSTNTPGIDIFQNDNFFTGSATPGGVSMSTLQTTYATAMAVDILNLANTVTYQPSTAYGVAGNMDSSVSDLAMGDYRGAVWDALQKINAANNSPIAAYIMKWDSALQRTAGFLFDDQTLSSPNRIQPSGYYNGRSVRTATGPRWNVTANSGGLLCMATTPSASDLTLKFVNAGRGAQSGRIAFSHWPINANGNGTLNMWQMTSSSTADGTRTIINVGSNASQAAGVSDIINVPDPSITIISSVA